MSSGDADGCGVVEVDFGGTKGLPNPDTTHGTAIYADQARGGARGVNGAAYMAVPWVVSGKGLPKYSCDFFLDHPVGVPKWGSRKKGCGVVQPGHPDGMVLVVSTSFN